MAYTPTLRLQKGSELTWQELDNNFINLQSEFNVLKAADVTLAGRINNVELLVGAAPGGLATTNLSDVSSFAPTQGQILTWHDATSEWIPNNPSALAGVNIGDLLDVNTTAAAIGNFLQFDGTTWMTSNVDLSVSVSKTGDTMTGALVLSADPTAALEAATKQYVDVQVANIVYATADFQTDFANSNVGDLLDVSNTAPANNQVLAWNGSVWAPANTETLVDTYMVGLDFDGNTDVLTASMSDGNTYVTTIPLSSIVDNHLTSLTYDAANTELTATMADGNTLSATIPDVRMAALSYDLANQTLNATMNDTTLFQATIPVTDDTVLSGITYDSNTWVFTASISDGTSFSTSIPDTDTKLSTLNYDRASGVLSGLMSDGSSVNTSIIVPTTDLPLDSMGTVNGNVTLDVSGDKRSFEVGASGSINILIGATGTTGVTNVVKLKVLGDGSPINWDSNIMVPAVTPFEPALGERALYELTSTDGGLSWFVSLQGIY